MSTKKSWKTRRGAVDAAEGAGPEEAEAREPPGGDRVGEVQRQLGAALVVGDEGGLPEQRLGEVLARSAPGRPRCPGRRRWPARWSACSRPAGIGRDPRRPCRPPRPPATAGSGTGAAARPSLSIAPLAANCSPLHQVAVAQVPPRAQRRPSLGLVDVLVPTRTGRSATG